MKNLHPNLYFILPDMVLLSNKSTTFDSKQWFMTSVTVKGIPEEISKFILKIQGQLKEKKCIGKLHQGQAIIHIIKEYKKSLEQEVAEINNNS